MPALLDPNNIITFNSDINFFSTSFSVLMSFILSTLVAFMYVWTLDKSTYSRNYLQAIVLISIIACVIIMSVGDSLARGVGIMAAVGIIRFRTNFKNPRDTIFLFAALAAGIACGANAFVVAIEGTLCFSIAALFLRYSSLSPVAYYDGEINIEIAKPHSIDVLDALLESHCKRYVLIHSKETNKGDAVQYNYSIKLLKNNRIEHLISQLKQDELTQKISFSDESLIN